MKNIYDICYHVDEDGNAAASIIYEYLKKINKDNNAKYFFHRIDYTVDLATVINNVSAGGTVYFVDYSFSNRNNLEYILELAKNGVEIIWIDHHKTSIDVINGKEFPDISLDEYENIHYMIDDKCCGAQLCYEYAYNNLVKIGLIDELEYPYTVPLYIKYVNSWDTWKHDMPDTLQFNYGIRAIEHTPRSTFSLIFNYNARILNKLFTVDDEVESYMKKFISRVISNGNVIASYNKVDNKYFCDDFGFSFLIIDNINNKIYSCFAANRRGNSTMFGNLFNEYDIVIPFAFNGEKYVYSFYTSKDDIDCSWIAKIIGEIDNLGGGGHKKAAGASTYTNILSSNCTVYINKRLFRKNKYKVFIVK